MRSGLSSLLLLLLVLPASAQRKYNKNITGPLDIATVRITGGYFDLGNDEEAPDRKPGHTVKLNDFLMSTYEIKQEQWECVMEANPSHHQPCAECPVTNVSWNEVQEFITKLNELTGKKYRLPTEAEWEYAARGGSFERLVKPSRPNRGGVNEFLVAERNRNTRTPEKQKTGDRYAGRKAGPQSIAWYETNSDGYVHPVGRKQPNDAGLYDMSGNAEEWCSDWYATSYGSRDTVENPQGPAGGKSKVVRGGSIESTAHETAVTRRAAYVPTTKARSLGFRLVLDK
ncbi:formylglycine-generating enzyme family protein [Nemorincola caseinilytica]|uniref:formylglycine-generating enzyme family protein n=1 Tax=Nemorincola caseinilytica TaxID=2054315 RepID=UPI0031EFA272